MINVNVEELTPESVVYWVDPGYSFKDNYQEELIKFIDECPMKINPSSRYWALKERSMCWNGYAFGLWLQSREDAEEFTKVYPSEVGIIPITLKQIADGKCRLTHKIVLYRMNNRIKGNDNPDNIIDLVENPPEKPLQEKIRDLVFREVGLYFFYTDVNKPKTTRMDLSETISKGVIELLGKEDV